MLAINSDTKFVLAEGISLQGIPELEHYFAFNTSTGDHFKLNHTAHWVLEAIGSETSFQGLIDKFAKEYDLSQDTAQEDLSEIIRYALENSIIEEVSA
ncbi:hypothetical protein BMS3Bbin14_00077 [bacterium BMS3Bbin14]|nr:hypothetical protein BMS3Bbin14_00077 [bacterium BMS3Bbin14]